MPVTMSLHCQAGDAKRVVVNDAMARPMYEQINTFPPLLNSHVGSFDSVLLGTNQFPYAELLQAKETLSAAGDTGTANARFRPQPGTYAPVGGHPVERPSPAKTAQIEREMHAVMSSVRHAEYLVTFTNLSGQDVPNADEEGGGSDPFVEVSLQGCSDLSLEEFQAPQLQGRTEVIRNAKDPAWVDAVKLWTPPGSAASLSIASQQHSTDVWARASKSLKPAERHALQLHPKPTVRVSLFDRDIVPRDKRGDTAARMGHMDTLVAAATLELGPDLQPGAHTLVLQGSGRFRSRQIPLSFTWSIKPYVPPPPATLLLRDIEVIGLRPPPPPPPHQRLHAAETQKRAVSRPSSPVRDSHVAPSKHLRIVLCEVGRKNAQVHIVIYRVWTPPRSAAYTCSLPIAIHNLCLVFKSVV